MVSKETNIINDILVEYQNELMNLTDKIAGSNYEYLSSGMANNNPIDKRMAVIKAKIETCNYILRRLS